MKTLIIEVRVNEYAMRDENPHVPWTAAEIGREAIGIGDYAYPELGYPTNAELVREIVKLAKVIGRDVATPEQARQMLGVD